MSSRAPNISCGPLIPPPHRSPPPFALRGCNELQDFARVDNPLRFELFSQLLDYAKQQFERGITQTNSPDLAVRSSRVARLPGVCEGDPGYCRA